MTSCPSYIVYKECEPVISSRTRMKEVNSALEKMRMQQRGCPEGTFRARKTDV